MNIRLAAAMNGVPDDLAKKPNNECASDTLPDGVAETEEGHREQWFVGSVDQGTTSSRFLIFDHHGEVVAGHQLEFENHYPESG